MEEMLPVSTLPPSKVLSITLFSCAGRLFFCLIATEDLPELPLLAGYVEMAIGELEQTVRDAHEA